MKSPVGPYGRRFSRSAFSARFCDGAEASASIGLTCRWRRLALTQPPLRLTSLLTWKSYSIRLGLTNGSLFLTDLRAPSQAECAPSSVLTPPPHLPQGATLPPLTPKFYDSFYLSLNPGYLALGPWHQVTFRRGPGVFR